MARNKNNLKKIEDFAERTGMMKPRSLSDDDIEDIQHTISDAFAQAKVNPKVPNRTERLQILRGLIEMETNPVKRELHERIFGIAARITHRRSAPLALSDEQPEQVTDEPLPLHERIRFLRKQKN